MNGKGICSMKDYKELVKRIRDGGYYSDDEVMDAIENLLNDIECRKTIAAGLVYLNNELAKACAEKAEQIYKLQAEIRQLNSENFWLCKGD